jgi:hypothetical protein
MYPYHFKDQKSWKSNETSVYKPNKVDSLGHAEQGRARNAGF